jgi:hypothetical protein
MASTFGADPPRWYSEPAASAITLYSSYRIALQGCLTLTGGGANYAAAPTQATAATECAAWEDKFWSRTPAQSEIDTCASFAVNDTASEPSAPRRWAYACATVLTSANFLTF